MFLLDLDPNIVKPGWTPLVITVVLGVVLVLLYLSMKRQVRRISVPYRGEGATPSGDAPAEGAPTEKTSTEKVTTEPGSTSTTGPG